MDSQSRSLRRLFRLMDRFSMIPMLRAGLGPLIGNPFTGYMMLLQTTGHRSGQPRATPMNYAILSGNLYCIARWGERADWVRNLRVHAQVEALLPGRTLAGVAEEVIEPDEYASALRQVLQNGGFAGFSQGINPFTASREELLAHTRGMLVFRIRPSGLPGLSRSPYDPGGWGWILPLLAGVGLVLCWKRHARRAR
jgi:deazaflavin-dependent oxidoreductase (nitroreductase family)